MQITSDSHLDHNVTDAQKQYALARFADRAAFFIESFELPEDLGTVPCGLHGPVVGDPPVPDAECTLAPRGTRAWTSRLCDRAPRPTRTVTVIAGPHGELPCVLYTMFGGPIAPQETGELQQLISQALAAEAAAIAAIAAAMGAGSPPESAKLIELRRKEQASLGFWRDHALSK